LLINQVLKADFNFLFCLDYIDIDSMKKMLLKEIIILLINLVFTSMFEIRQRFPICTPKNEFFDSKSCNKNSIVSSESLLCESMVNLLKTLTNEDDEFHQIVYNGNNSIIYT
jgi:hypothetical protein